MIRICSNLFLAFDAFALGDLPIAVFFNYCYDKLTLVIANVTNPQKSGGISMMRKKIIIAVFVLAAILFSWMTGPTDAASRYEAVLARWSKTESRRDDLGNSFTIKATL